MVKASIVVRNKSGLHLRPASVLAGIAAKLCSEVMIIAGDKKVDPKSALLLMSAGISYGTEIEIVCEGESEKEDLQIMLDAISGGLGE